MIKDSKKVTAIMMTTISFNIQAGCMSGLCDDETKEEEKGSKSKGEDLNQKKPLGVNNLKVEDGIKLEDKDAVSEGSQSENENNNINEEYNSTDEEKNILGEGEDNSANEEEDRGMGFRNMFQGRKDVIFREDVRNEYIIDGKEVMPTEEWNDNNILNKDYLKEKEAIRENSEKEKRKIKEDGARKIKEGEIAQKKRLEDLNKNVEEINQWIVNNMKDERLKEIFTEPQEEKNN